ncbi:TPA: hypothetical protein ACXDUQ_004042 [Clostridioides difficile]|uniref:hypothetical protein n=2 Tax=Clostridioides difficile TaxID=1496 RepID=UPI001A8D99EE|nr:hypothetical protein [Clostridioides difficile]EGT4850027.1 hypothetical protein [Clostridioides difficile]MCG3604409.1 hypothetical protein [Clostridioides difficile]MCI9897883.1 hypothetical protein [Clostridioides difficile]MCI9970811.1 hypothetical protein [Clostridioides difficile]MCJ0169070.1 hypothetical protein [Clostridioides difficile]
MNKFELFKKVIVGNFNNLEQVEKEKSEGKVIHPIAKHVNRICNDKIKNLPKEFKGIFVIEESYYTDIKTDRTNILPHLFLFEEVENGQVKLTSYEIPKDISKKDFTNSNEELKMDYNELEVSTKFMPMIYEYKEDKGFYGKSLSDFGRGMTFLLEETLSENEFEVNEILKRGDQVLVGFETPIIYRREI